MPISFDRFKQIVTRCLGEGSLTFQAESYEYTFFFNAADGSIEILGKLHSNREWNVSSPQRWRTGTSHLSLVRALKRLKYKKGQT